MKKVKLMHLFFSILLIFTTQLSTAQAVDKTIPKRFSALWVGSSFEGRPCDGGKQGYGPFDYSKRSSYPSYNLFIVEVAHFTPKVEQLRSGQSSTLEEDLNYTLRAWPNHHRALLSVTRLDIQLKKKLRGRSEYQIKNGDKYTPPECYFKRALKFSPKDAATYSLYAYYLKQINMLEESSEQYKKALSLKPNSLKIKYTYAFLLIKQKEYNEALKLAKEIYKHKGAPKGLMNTLKKLNRWKY